MWVYSKDEKELVNSNNVTSFGIIELGKLEFVEHKYEIFADNSYLGYFQTEDEAKKELKQIYDALIAGQESYSVG